MKFKVVLPLGVEKKTLFVGDSTITITEGQIVTNDAVQKHYPQFFEDMEGKKEVLVETKPVEVKAEEPMELLIEQPERIVEVEIIADETVVAPEEVIDEVTTVEDVVTEEVEAPVKKAPAKKAPIKK